jgi:hypothetical protein
LQEISRRKFLKVVGSGSIALAGASLVFGGADLLGKKTGDALAFKAITGLPSVPLPSYASYVVEGGVNLATRTGVITATVFAGHPEEVSNLALPGLTRTLRVTGVEVMGPVVRVTGKVTDPSTLLPGEKHTVDLRIDREAGTLRTEFLGKEVVLTLD